MSDHPAYRSQPLVEAVFELFAPADEQTSWNVSSPERVRADLPEYSWHEEHLRDIGIQLEVQKGSLLPLQSPTRERVRRWDKQRNRAVQFGSHMCAYNILAAAYTHFREHRGDVRRVFDLYIGEARPARLGWTGQRYINVVKIPINEPGVSDYFEIYPRLPDSLSGGHRPLAVQVQTVEFRDGKAMVNLSLQGKDECHAIYLLDIYARSDRAIPIEVDALMSWQTDAHEAIWQSFDLSVSEKAKQIFRRSPDVSSS